MFGYFWEKVDIDARICLSPCLVLPIARDEAPTLLREKVRFCRAVANGLSELHRAGVVHGDLRLSNVLLFGRKKVQKSASSSLSTHPPPTPLLPALTLRAGEY
jgi:serine/threonine protein kinase